MPNDATFALRDAFLRSLHGEELVRPRDFFLTGVEDYKIANQIEQPLLAAHLRKRAVEQRTGSRRRGSRPLVLPLHEELFRRAGRSVAQPLRVAAGEDKLHGAKERLVEDLFLICDELPDAVSDLHRAAFQLDYADRESVEIEHDVWPSFVATFQSHFFGEREVVLVQVLPIDEVHRLVGLARGGLHLYPVTQELIGTKVRLIGRSACRVGGGFELLEGGGNVRVGVSAGLEVVTEERRLDRAVILPFA